jgi:hypothetical protein
MLKCWDKDRRLRPSFQDILVTIDQWIESPEVLHQPMPSRFVLSECFTFFNTPAIRFGQTIVLVNPSSNTVKLYTNFNI